MNYYYEITLINSIDHSLYHTWSKLFMQLHLAFVETKAAENHASIGVSFPEYLFNPEVQIGFLGSKLRVFAKSHEELNNLKINSWLDTLSDYVHISSIKSVPHDKVNGYSCYYRKKAVNSLESLVRRRSKRANISLEDAKLFYTNAPDLLDFPFIQLQSLSSHHPFKLFIGKNHHEKPVDGTFSLYGLSTISTVPEF